MEQNANTGVPMTPVIDNEQKNGNSLKIVTLIACVVAVCGIGFGVYGMIQSAQKDGQISDLEVQIKKDDGTITAIETPEIETNTNDGTTVTITDTTKVSGGPYIENGYFYVPYWGVKYKLSDELTDYGYAVNQESMWYSTKDDRYAISLTSVKKTDVPSMPPQAQTLDNIFTCSMVIVRRVTKEYADEIRSTWPSATFVDYGNDYTFILQNETGFVGSCSVDKETARTASEIILNDVLSHPEAI